MAMSQNLLVKNFKRVKDIYEFYEGFIKSSNEESDREDVLLKMIFNILKNHITSQWFIIFAWKNEDWKSRKACS